MFACGGAGSVPDAGGGSVAACSVSDDSSDNGGITLCVDYGSGWGSGAAMSDCTTNQGGNFQSSSCSSVNRVGRCTLTDMSSGTTMISTYNYYSPTVTSDAQSQCSGYNSGGITATYAAN
jgi:hypothetical protein